MKAFVAGVVLAIVVALPASVQSYDPDVGTGNIGAPSDVPYAGAHAPFTPFAQVVPGGERFRSPYTAHGAVMPFGTPDTAAPSRKNGGEDARTAAVCECSAMARKYTQTTWGTYEMHQFAAAWRNTATRNEAASETTGGPI